jgi:hypothetical protein
MGDEEDLSLSWEAEEDDCSFPVEEEAGKGRALKHRRDFKNSRFPTSMARTRGRKRARMGKSE